MSELLQSGQFPGASGHHPDADQLSAFIEQALPTHERRQVLAHLAICQDCRETIALSLPALEIQPAPAPAHRPWWHGWSIFVPAALAVAASVFFVVHLRRANTSISIPAQVATSKQPSPIVPPPRQASAPSRSPSAAEQQATARTANRLAQPPAPSALRLQQDEIAAAPQATPQPAQAPPAALTGESAQSLPAQSHASANRLILAAPAAAPLPPSVNAPAGSAAQTVSIAGAAPPLNTVSDSSALRLAQPAAPAVPLKNPLPSGLAVASIAANGPTLLAIDAHNAVFLSADSGEHWTAVSAPWHDRAVRVSLVARTPANAPAMGAASGRSLATFANALRLQPAMNASLSGVITDASGAVVSGASVTVRDASTSAGRTVTTDDKGRYLAEGLAPGSYSIEAAAPGFATQRVANVAVNASRQTTENLALQPGSVSESVTVESSADLIASPRAAKSKALKSPQAAAPPQAIFEITTDTGERWTSTDGAAWRRE